MRWAERCTFAGAFLLAGLAHSQAPAYGKVETFQPGKKYNCVPTPDHKAWDCSESASAARQQPREDTSAVSAASPPSPPAAEPAPKASALPSYLTNPAANRRATSAPAPAPAASPPATRTSMPPPQAPVEIQAGPPAAAQARAPVREKSPAPPPPADQPAAAAEPAAKPAPVAPSQPPAPRSDSEFASLPGAQYVIELAHGGANVDAPAVPSGKVYKLHLRQNGSERWLLLWGPFDSVESARAARDAIAAQGTTPGWPRRIAPLQAEARNTRD